MLTQKQENFCQNILAGKTQYDAFLSAGYANHPNRAIVDTNASILANCNKIKLRLAELRTAAAAPLIATHTEIQEILSDIARARLTNFLDASGQPYLTPETPHNRAAREYHHKTRIDRNGNPIVSKHIKIADPVEAARELNKMQGNYAPTRHLGLNKVRIEIIHEPQTKLTESTPKLIETGQTKKLIKTESSEEIPF